jgi:hypothetical protein
MFRICPIGYTRLHNNDRRKAAPSNALQNVALYLRFVVKSWGAEPSNGLAPQLPGWLVQLAVVLVHEPHCGLNPAFRLILLAIYALGVDA